MRNFLQRLLYLIYTLLGLEAVRLNLRVYSRNGTRYYFWRHDMSIKIGEFKTATIAPKNVKGDAAPVFNAVYVDGSSYDVVIAADGLSAVFTAKAEGSGNAVVVTATSKSGATLSETTALPDVDAPAVDEEAVTLNLTVA